MESAKSTLEKIVFRALKNAPREEAALWAWPLACGSAVAARTEALSCDGVRLRVAVPDATWRAQLADFVPQYLAAIERLVQIKLEAIDFEPVSAKISSHSANANESH
jgi:hypothetical protein